MGIEEKLDLALQEAETENISNIESAIPKHLAVRIKSWKFGNYGWTSPVNIMMTCAWYKWLNPNQDICKIWANDHLSQKIAGGFALRSMDEKYTIRVIAKSRIANDFCSPNSGMQGSRAIEKMRGMGRINRDEPVEQSVSFDMPLFQNILNDINECNSAQANNVFKLFLKYGLQIRAQREKTLSGLQSSISNTLNSEDVLSFALSVKDPQFFKALTIVVMREFIRTNKFYCELTLSGIDGAKTAADARAKSAGDFWFEDQNKKPIVAVEVKDPSKKIGFDIIAAIGNRKVNNPSIQNYFLVSAAREPVESRDLNDKDWNSNIANLRNGGLNVLIYSLYDLFSLACMSPNFMKNFANEINQVLGQVESLKPDTIKNWLEFLANKVNEG